MDMNKNYLIGDKLGKGSFGIVYLVDNKVISNQRAMKKVKFSESNENNKKEIEKTKLEIRNEINILKLLNHPNILKLYEYYDQATSMFIITEYCQGGEMMKNSKKLPSFQVAVVMYQLFLAINYYQSKNIIHRDLKPENILIKKVDDSGLFHIRVIDFGVAIVENTVEEKEPRKKAVAGSLNYMAPEVFSGNYSFECDLWSCGVILFLLLTGKFPFDGENENETIQLIKQGKYNKNLLSSQDSNEKNLISDLLEVNPKKRITVKKALDHSLFKSYNCQKLLYETDRDGIFKIFKNLIKFCINIVKGNYSPFYVFCLLYITYNMPRDDEEVSLIFKVFSFVDTNKTCYLDYSSFSKFISKISIGMTNISEKVNIAELAKVCFECIDFNNDCKIEFSEFLVACISPSLALKKEYIELVFELFDKDRKRELSWNNFVITLNSNIIEENSHDKVNTNVDLKSLLNFEFDLSEDDVYDILKIKKLNKQSAVSYDDFCKLLFQHLKY